jgi:hypothetical protein
MTVILLFLTRNNLRFCVIIWRCFHFDYMLSNLVVLAPPEHVCCRSAISGRVHSLVWCIRWRQPVQVSSVNWAYNVVFFLIKYQYQFYRICPGIEYVILLRYSCILYIYVTRPSVYPSFNCFLLTTCMHILIGNTYTWSGYDENKTNLCVCGH